MSRGLLLAAAALINSALINGQTNMAVWAHQINTNILFTNHKLFSIHSESVPRNKSKVRTFSFAEKGIKYRQTEGFYSI